MLYIHQLKDLTPKAADIESTFIIRDIKKTTPYPLDPVKILDSFSLYYVSESEKTAIREALEYLSPTIEEIRVLLASKDNDLEPVNLQRAINMLSEIPAPLMTNFTYASDIADWQEQFVQEFPIIFNNIPKLKTAEKDIQVEYNNKLNEIFQKLLRNDVMSLNYKDIVNEAQRVRVEDLAESMERGFFFRVYLEEEIRKDDFHKIKRRIPVPKLQYVDQIREKVLIIKKGVDAAYNINLRMVNWALVVYAYIKWLNG